MVRAVIMVETGTAKSTEIIDAILDLPAVVEAHVVAGEFDIIAEVEVDEVYEVLQTASQAIQAVDGVTDTRTYVSLD